MPLRVGCVVARAVPHLVDLCSAERADRLGGAPRPSFAGANRSTARQQRPHAQHRIAFHGRAVEQRRAQANEAAVPNGGAVRHRRMADQRVVADDRGKAFIDMNRAAVLDVRSLADADGIHVGRTQLNQMLDPAPISTSPITIVPGARKTSAAMRGVIGSKPPAADRQLSNLNKRTARCGLVRSSLAGDAGGERDHRRAEPNRHDQQLHQNDRSRAPPISGMNAAPDGEIECDPGNDEQQQRADHG